MPQPSDPSAEPKKPGFPTTHWTLVKKIQRGSEEDARKALEEVCRTYWYPVYGYLRRSGQQPHDAEDLTQAFFQKLIEDRSIDRARMEKGRLRAFLLGVLKRTLSDHFRALARQKRGGGQQIISFDEADAEGRYTREPADPKSPDAIFDRAWAERVLKNAEAQLRGECERSDDIESFVQLAEFLPLGENATPYAKVAARLKIAEPTMRLQIHRMRKRYAKLIEAQIAQTVTDPAEQKAELAHLMAAMGR